MSEEARLEKQNFLREQIIDKGYDGQKFQEYLESKKKYGSEIDQWELEELKLMVRNFQKLNKPIVVAQEPQPNPDQQQNQAENQNNNQGEEAKAQKQLGDEWIEIDPKQQILYGQDEQFQKEWKCIRIEQTEIQENPNAQAFVKNYQKVEGGVFSSPYVVYEIVTEPFHWVVTRRYNEFFQLRDILAKLYPAHLVPPIPKKTNVRKYQPLFINKRMNFLERFLNKVLKSPELRGCKFVEAFLKMQDGKDLTKILKDADKIQKVASIDKQQSTTGKIQLEYNRPMEIYLGKAGDFLQNCESIYKKIRKLSKQLILDYDQLSSTIFSIGDCFSSLYTQSNLFNKNITVGKNTLLNDIYVTLNNMKISWGNAITSQIQLVQDNLCNAFKFYHQELISAKELLKQREQVSREFFTENKRLIQKKDKIFSSQNIHFYEIPKEKLSQFSEQDKARLLKDKVFAFSQMLPKESSYENFLRCQNAYYTKTAFEEIQRTISDKVKEYSQHFMNFGKLQSENISQMHILWADTMTSLVSLEMGKKRQVMENKRQKSEEIQEAVDI